MCRNIHTLFNFEPPATEDEVRGASLQYVRKISGFTKPSQANQQTFARAVDEVAAASKRLLDALVTSAPAKDRSVEAARAGRADRARGRPTRRGSTRAARRRPRPWSGARPRVHSGSRGRSRARPP